jgi:hypothetical protein
MVAKNCCFKYCFQHSTSTKPILKEVFINCIQNKISQLPNNAIIKKNIFVGKKKPIAIYYKVQIYFLNDSNNCKT